MIHKTCVHINSQSILHIVTSISDVGNDTICKEWGKCPATYSSGAREFYLSLMNIIL